MKNLIFIVMHKQYKVTDKLPYKSIAVGANKDTFDTNYKDDIGKENIANKNSTYCELTAHYWVWKNIANDYDNIGLNHYRRYFGNSRLQRTRLLQDNKITKYLKKYDIILPDPWYWKMTVAEKYYIDGWGRKKDILTTREAIKKYYPDYLKAFDIVMKQNHASYCNMFITNRENFVKYSNWLFKILKYVEKNIDISNYTPEEQRVFGYLSELLLNVWVYKNGFRIKYLPMIQKELPLSYKVKSNIKFFLIKRIYSKFSKG